MHPVAPLVDPDVPAGVVGQLEQGHSDVLAEVAAAVERIEPVSAGQPGRGVDVPGAPGRAARPGPGNPARCEAGSGQVHGAEADHGGHPRAQAGGYLRGPPVDQCGAAAGQPDPVDPRPERGLDPADRPGGGQQQAIPQGWPGGDVVAAQPGADRGQRGPRRAEAGLDPPRAEEPAEPGRTGGSDLGGQPAEAAGVGGAQRHGDVQCGRAGLRAGDPGPGGNPGRRADRRHRAGPRPGLAARRGGTGAVQACRADQHGGSQAQRARRPRPSLQHPRVPCARSSQIRGMLEEPGAAAGDPTNRARPARARACCS